MSVQAISWTPSGAVRVLDQRALPDMQIERDLESAEAVADAIRHLEVRGAPLIGIAAAMGLVAGTRDLRGGAREAYLARLTEDVSEGRAQSVQELRGEIRLLARTIAALAEEGGN